MSMVGNGVISFGGNSVYVDSFAITNITQGNPGVVTLAAAHNFINGEIIRIFNVTTMTQVLGVDYTFRANAATATSFQLYRGNTAVNTTSFTAFGSSGGNVRRYDANVSVAVETKYGAPSYTSRITVQDPDPRTLAANTVNANAKMTGGTISWTDWYGQSLNPFPVDPAMNPFTTNAGTNRWSISGIGAGGNGPPGSPGSYRCQGSNYSMCTWLSLRIWSSNSGGGYTISNDMILVNTTPLLDQTRCTYYGLDFNNVRAINAPITFRLDFRVDHALSVGYWTVTMSTPPNCNDIRRGSYTELGYFYESGGGRQSLSNRRFTLPPPTGSDQFILLALNDRGRSEGSCGGGPHGWDSMTITIV